MAEVVLDPAAQRDITQAVRYYENEKENLGKAFIEAVKRGLDLIGRHPLLCRVVYRNFRRYLLMKFPYEIIFVYAQEEDYAFVIAVFHQRQHPSKWHQRIQKNQP